MNGPLASDHTPYVTVELLEAVTDIFEATIVWFSVERRVPVVAGPSGCDSLLGMELLEGCRIELDRTLGEVRIVEL